MKTYIDNLNVYIRGDSLNFQDIYNAQEISEQITALLWGWA